MEKRAKVAIIGAGVVGTALGYLLKKGGYSVAGIASRTLQSAEKAREFIGEGEVSTYLSVISRKANIVFITTSDRAIKTSCNKIASENGFRPGAAIFHTCGALSSDVLRAARNNGAYVASIHPLQSLASAKEAVSRLRGSYFCIEGDKPALSVAKDIISTLGGKEINLKVNKKPLYHAGACAASNFLVSIVAFGLELFEAAGINRKDSLRSLMPLIKGTVKNIERLGIPSALTGPVARGDTDVVQGHLKALSKGQKDLARLYAELGNYTVKVAIEKGTLKEKTAGKLISLFNKIRKESGYK